MSNTSSEAACLSACTVKIGADMPYWQEPLQKVYLYYHLSHHLKIWMYCDCYHTMIWA